MTQQKQRFRLHSIGLALGLLAAPLVLMQPNSASAQSSQSFPQRPIELIVPYQAGGSTDGLARAFADASRKHTPQPIVVVNKPGAGGAIGTNEVINAKPDGYKLGVITNDVLTVPLLGMAKFSYNDMEVIAQINSDPVTIVVRADAPWKNINDFLAAGKKADGVRVGTSGNGTLNHLAAASLAEKTGAKIEAIPYLGAAPAILSLLGGHIEAVTATPAEVISHLQAGSLRILMTLGEERTKVAPAAPTAREAGIDLAIVGWRYLAVTKKTPPEVVSRLRQIVTETAQDPAMAASLEKLNIGYQFTPGPEFQHVLDKDYQVTKTLLSKANIKP